MSELRVIALLMWFLAAVLLLAIVLMLAGVIRVAPVVILTLGGLVVAGIGVSAAMRRR